MSLVAGLATVILVFVVLQIIRLLSFKPEETKIEPTPKANDDFMKDLHKLIEEAAAKPPMMSLSINESGSSVELFLDTKSGSYYGEWIPGEGGDICLYKDQETKKVVGCHLPLYQTDFIATHSKKDGSYEVLCEPKFNSLPSTIVNGSELKMENKTKQVIVMRTDTDPPMRKGKMIAQGGHASCAFLTRRCETGEKLTKAMKEWMESSYAKICVRVDSEDELLDIYAKAQAAGLEVHLITDSGKTEFKEPTRTCLAIGPDYCSNIDPITSHLKLL